MILDVDKSAAVCSKKIHKIHEYLSLQFPAQGSRLWIEERLEADFVKRQTFSKVNHSLIMQTSF